MFPCFHGLIYLVPQFFRYNRWDRSSNLDLFCFVFTFVAVSFPATNLLVGHIPCVHPFILFVSRPIPEAVLGKPPSVVRAESLTI
ncbi:hypothetical protein AN477_00035 [Alicyclobacillus ferrooxydans]|uniref:Uncharacterized protein n=1 Tax=Alicyclobacillus ferrooxydans TaxID=471514 RepID=A0A0P9GWS8_9BACL|nr:hypothetical protein AN477_00035 [Alicyclobacillus ferrooxydans]